MPRRSDAQLGILSGFRTDPNMIGETLWLANTAENEIIAFRHTGGV
jgi:hypothetical protein